MFQVSKQGLLAGMFTGKQPLSTSFAFLKIDNSWWHKSQKDLGLDKNTRRRVLLGKNLLDRLLTEAGMHTRISGLRQVRKKQTLGAD